MHYAEERIMKTYANLILIVLAQAVVIFHGQAARAYAATQEEQWQADLNEARARARDFEKHLARLRSASRERESAAQEIKVERRRDDERIERARREFIKDRDSRPSTEIVELRLEREHLKQLAAEARAAEKVRARYASDRDRMENMMHKEAYINPAREYDAYSARPVAEQEEITKSYAKPLLKLNIKSGDSKR